VLRLLERSFFWWSATMGARFQLDHANIVAYLTAPWSDEAPAVTLKQLKTFLFSLQEAVPISPHGSQPPELPKRIVSSRETWKSEIQRRAKLGVEKLSAQYAENDLREDILSRSVTKGVLGPLRDEFTRFELYALFVGKVSNNPQIESFWLYASQVSEGSGL